VKLPRPTGHYAVVAVTIGDSTKANRGYGPRYRIDVCTSNLNANNSSQGEPVLKHCFAKIIDGTGKLIKTYAFGRRGVADEPYVVHESVRCAIQAEDISTAQISDFESTFSNLGRQPYQWGKHDCCAILNKAVKQGLDTKPQRSIDQAAADIRYSREIL